MSRLQVALSFSPAWLPNLPIVLANCLKRFDRETSSTSRHQIDNYNGLSLGRSRLLPLRQRSCWLNRHEQTTSEDLRDRNVVRHFDPPSPRVETPSQLGIHLDCHDCWALQSSCSRTEDAIPDSGAWRHLGSCSRLSGKARGRSIGSTGTARRTGRGFDNDEF